MLSAKFMYDFKAISVITSTMFPVSALEADSRNYDTASTRRVSLHMIFWALPSWVLFAIVWSIIMWFVTTFMVIDNMMTGWDVL